MAFIKNNLLTYVAETKVILREIYSILIGNDSLLKRPQVIKVMSLANRIAFTEFLYPATLKCRGIMLYLSVSVRPSMLTISDR